MPQFAVMLERASAWDWSVPMRRQKLWNEHAAFMDGLADEGFIVAGGPLGNEDTAKRMLHIVRASNPEQIEKRLAEDPWRSIGMLKTASIEPWTVLLGVLRHAANAATQDDTL